MEKVPLDTDLKHDLQRKKESLMQQSTFGDHKYFHLNTIDNLIYHFNEIKTIKDKRWVYATLDNYFNECTNYINSLNRDTSTYLYHQYLDKITDYYNSKLDFVLITNRALFVTFYFILFLISYFAFNVWVSIIPIVILIIRSYIIYKKWKDKKVYSLFY